ncbi:hypothetical protein ACH4SP_12155 [Streptomyces sp. NPDC021093]|uniref:hypothetical protein n=1 Tax=Streptomyces sp. NPDC021093 TaxID=3365112 RepID=UPI003791E024
MQRETWVRHHAQSGVQHVSNVSRQCSGHVCKISTCAVLPGSRAAPGERLVALLEQDHLSEKFESGSAVEPPLDLLDAVDGSFDTAGAPVESVTGCHCVEVSEQMECEAGEAGQFGRREPPSHQGVVEPPRTVSWPSPTTPRSS